MSDVEVLGDVVTGGMIGRALEPSAGEGDGHTQEGDCLNCGAVLEGPFCHACGQHAHVHRTLRAFFHDFLHGVLHFEGKIWRTIPMLAWCPGALTRRYIDGQRARFVSPIALFLFCVFLTFAVMGLTGALDETTKQAGRSDLSAEVENARERVQDLTADRAEAVQEKRSTARIDDKLHEARIELGAVEALRTAKTGKRSKSTAKVQLSERTPEWLKGVAGKASENPELLFYKVKTNAYKFSWALIPISAPFVWLLFPFSRRFRMYDHTVFVTYSLCFMMLLLAIGTTLDLIVPAVATAAWFVPPIHMYRQLRGAYGVGRFGAVWRTVALTVFAFVAIGLFASFLVGLGALD